jgi:LacI family transcriptional regulator
MQQVRRIALLMSRDAGFYRQVLIGIQAYAMETRAWSIRSALPERSSLRPLRDWNPHGIIADMVDETFARSLLKMGKPVVDITCALSELKVPIVDVDHHAVGSLAAEYFLGLGYRSFGFFGSDCVWYARLREAGFQERLQKAGVTLSSCHLDYLPRLSPRVSWTRVNRQTRQWLKRLARPVAVLASNDVPAHDLADACQQLGLHVPDDVAILGVGNDELECQLAFPPLSSIAIPGDRIGYEAARVLNRQILGEPRPAKPLLLPPVRVVIRQSTSALAVDDPAVAAAVRYIRNHLGEPIRVATLVNTLGVHRRELERKFRAVLGRSVLEEIHRARIEHAKQLLVGSDMSMSHIARRCGFSTAQRLAIVFRQTAGLVPSSYRRQFRVREA